MKKFAKDFYQKFRDQQLKENKAGLIYIKSNDMSLEQKIMADMKDAMES